MRPSALTRPSRRAFLAATATATATATAAASGAALLEPSGRGEPTPEGADAGKALIAITLDLEMSRNFPTWDQTHWDYEKGNLDAATKAYAAEAARRVQRRGGRIHFFALGRTMEQADVSWLQELAGAGHPIGNHTYDHVNVKAKRPEDIQFRFRRAPWLVEGQSAEAIIEGNIRLSAAALKQRAGIAAAGFRTPGGFHDGLADRPDLQRMLLRQGYTWVSSKYPAHAVGATGQPPGPEVLASIVSVQAQAQPFVYPTGLVEVPMSPISDVTAFRAGRWPLAAFLAATRQAVSWAIDHRAVFCFLAHPSCLVATDPEFRSIELICDLVTGSADRAAFADLETIARRARNQKTTP